MIRAKLPLSAREIEEANLTAAGDLSNRGAYQLASTDSSTEDKTCSTGSPIFT